MHLIITAKNTTVAFALGVTLVHFHELEVLRYDALKRTATVRVLNDNACLCRVNQSLRALGLPQRAYLRGDSVELCVLTEKGEKTIATSAFPRWNEPGAFITLNFTAVPVQGVAVGLPKAA